MARRLQPCAQVAHYAGDRSKKGRILASLVSIALVGAQARDASAWGTEEHILFGNQIATPFEEDLFAGPLPVFESDLDGKPGPRRFAHWVSAPDFGRSLALFLNLTPLAGDLACAVLWEDKDVVLGGVEMHDQIFVEGGESGFLESALSLLQNRARLDCVSLQAVNNNHFGDFARHQYNYYHSEALEAARRYRATRNPECRKAAYTLEGWAQHHLTDSTAAGHAWNPPGHYGSDGLVFSGKFITKLTGLPIRLRIHNQLNSSGAEMAAPLHDHGHFHGDHSENTSAHGDPVAAHEHSSPQKELTLRLARMGLGEVIAAAECGSMSPREDAVFITPDAAEDPRKAYVSNETMCQVMWEFVPDFLVKRLFEHPELRAFVDDCEGGVYGGDDPDGDIFSSCYFKDIFANTDTSSCAVEPTIDEKSMIGLEELGCPAVAPGGDSGVVAAVDDFDLCGQRVCEVPMRADGSCPSGTERSAGCCHPFATVAPVNGGTAEMSSDGWTELEVTRRQDLTTPAAYPGAASSFLWIEGPSSSAPVPESWKRLNVPRTATLSAEAATIHECGDEVGVSVYETRVRTPQTTGFQGKQVVLQIDDMDEAVRITVDGHLVAHVDRAELSEGEDFSHARKLGEPIRVPLLTQSTPKSGADGHLVRVTHVNACEGARDLEVRLGVQSQECDKCDFLSEAESPGGCGAGGSSSGRGTPMALLLLAAGLLLRRRRRDP